MKLSIIIVNYNVRYFLEQCLHSVLKASSEIDSEVIVVDNASADGSCHMVRSRFPGVRLIENHVNAGYSVANNQAIRESSGEYILLLNPDTVVEEDTFAKAIGFMDEHPDAGGLGVKMIDGKGRFLPESKRGLPTPRVAFYKIFGLSALFPRSREFGKYHLTYLDENKTHIVDVLCGAFMFLRRQALEKTGLLDESFFMYGEDIDMSCRISRAGYKNYYFPGTTIIHYKGESTRKNSINYIKMFYLAMVIFAKKHFSKGNAEMFSLLIHFAVWFRAFIAVILGMLRKIWLPAVDALLVLAGFAFMLPLWEKTMYAPGYYPDMYLRIVVPAYILFWLSGVFFSGGYRQPVNLLKLERGVFWGTISLLLAYSLIPENLRFSRALIGFGSLWALLILPLFRLVMNRLKLKQFELDLEKSKRIAIAGRTPEILRVREMLALNLEKPLIAGYIALPDDETGEEYLGDTGQIREIVRVNRIDEVIFCAENIPAAEIIRAMRDLADLDVDFKIAPPESMSIIGSNSIHTAGDLYLIDINAVTRPENKRVKRTLDFLLAFTLLLFFWISVWLVKNKKQLLKNSFQVLSGKISWVGYTPCKEKNPELPVLKKGILNPAMLFPDMDLSDQRKKQLDILYAKDYRMVTDLELVLRNLNKLDLPPYA